MMKMKVHFVFVLAGFFLLQSCSIFKPAIVKKAEKPQSPFFDNIEVNVSPTSVSAPIVTKEKETSIVVEEEVKAPSTYLSDLQGIEYIPLPVFRYASILDVEVEKLKNRSLINYIDEWWGTPYHIGGTTKNGIDCSGFVKGLTSQTFGIELPRSSREQANFCQKINREELREGDLVFFSHGRNISHVGMYLANNKFVHASTSMGVIISDLDEPYWKKRFSKAGRLVQ